MRKGAEMATGRAFCLGVAVLLSAGAAGATAKRAAVVLIPLDRNAFAAAVRLGEYLEDSVDRYQGYALKESALVYGDSTPTAALEARKRVIRAVEEGKKLLLAGQLDEAENALRASLLDADNAAAALEKCAEYCDALAFLSSVQLMKGDEPGAREALKNLYLMDRGYRFDGPAFGKSFQLLAKDIQKASSSEGELGSISIQTTPAGGRVFLDGQYRGYSPLAVERVAVGRHLLRVERPGSITFGQVLEVTGADEVVRVKLTSTPEYAALEGTLGKVADELGRGAGGSELMKLGIKLKVDRALVGTVSTRGTRMVLDCVLVDFAARRRLGRQSRGFEGDEYGELAKEVRRFGNSMLAGGDGKVDVKATQKTSTDPLDGRSGMEDWDEESTAGGGGGGGGGEVEPRPAAGTRKVPRRSGDPLDEGQGTGDW